MFRDANGWIGEYKAKSALWLHDGNPKRPHALLTGGEHSNGFFNSRPVIPDEVLLREAASDLISLFILHGGDVGVVDGVVGPQTGATKLAEFMSHQLAIFHSSTPFSASPAKNEQDGVKSMVFSDEERALLPGKTVLLGEDVTTTGGSVLLTAGAVINAGGIVLPFILTLVNRSGLAEVNGRKILALIDRAMPKWTLEECPLCKAGSEAIRPKGAEEWMRLNAQY